MANFGSRITNASLSALSAQQAIIAATANNIANVNTPGYARRIINLEPRQTGNGTGGLNIGDGVEVSTLLRQADEYIENVLRGATAENSSAQIQNEFLSRVEPLFSLAGDRPTIGSTLESFFSSLRDLEADPSSIAIRAKVISSANEVVDAIRTTFNTLADLQGEADRRIETEIETVNTLVQDIAELNGLIVNREAAGQVAADDRDKRDALMIKLAEKISFSTTRVNDGSVNISLANGFSLVSGSQHREIELTSTPSFASGTLPPSLGGEILRYIVFDYSGTGVSHVDLTDTFASGDGSIAGLLAIRGVADATQTSAFEASGSLVELASRVEAITRNLLTSFNQTYLGPDENGGAAGHQPSAVDLDGNTPSVYGFFDFQYSGTKDADGDGLPDDLTAVGLANYSSLLQLTSEDPRDIAAARDQDTTGGVISFAPGDSANIAALLALSTANQTFSAGSFSQTGSFADVYGQAVNRIGTLKASAEIGQEVSAKNLIALQNRRDEVSGVNLDEEFSRLIGAQRYFQAAARLIKVADDLLSQLVSLI